MQYYNNNKNGRDSMKTGKYPKKKLYDELHDVLHVYLDPRCNEYDATAEEDEYDIYIMKDDDTDEIVGF